MKKIFTIITCFMLSLAVFGQYTVDYSYLEKSGPSNDQRVSFYAHMYNMSGQSMKPNWERSLNDLAAVDWQ